MHKRLDNTYINQKPIKQKIKIKDATHCSIIMNTEEHTLYVLVFSHRSPSPLKNLQELCLPNISPRSSARWPSGLGLAFYVVLVCTVVKDCFRTQRLNDIYHSWRQHTNISALPASLSAPEWLSSCFHSSGPVRTFRVWRREVKQFCGCSIMQRTSDKQLTIHELSSSCEPSQMLV